MHACTQAEPAVSCPRIDEDILNEVIRLGFERSVLVDSIKARVQNKATVAYYLMCDNRCVRCTRPGVQAGLPCSKLACERNRVRPLCTRPGV